VVFLFLLLAFLVLSNMGSWQFHVIAMVFVEIFLVTLPLSFLFSVWVERKNKLRAGSTASATASKDLAQKEKGNENQPGSIDPLDTFLESKIDNQ